MLLQKKNLLTVVVSTALALSMGGTATAAASPSNVINVDAGQTYVVDTTTRVSQLNIADGGRIAAPEGYTVTLTVNGVETGSFLAGADREYTEVGAGRYRGKVVLTVAPANEVTIDPITFPLRPTFGEAKPSAGRETESPNAYDLGQHHPQGLLDAAPGADHHDSDTRHHLVSTHRIHNGRLWSWPSPQSK